MSRNTYAPKQTYLGDGTVALYTFDFKIEVNTQLEIIEVDALGVETQRVRGDDNVYLNNVTYDPAGGGGSVQLQANLITGRSLIILLANDAPTQPYEFSNKLSFNLKSIERALDFLGGAIQRLAYRGKQALRIHDSENEELVDGQLPPDLAGNLDAMLKVNAAGNGFEYGPTPDQISASSDISADFTVTIPGSQGRFNNGDIVLEGTSMEQVIIDMLQVDTPPIFSLAGNGSFLVESGTLITPTLTPTYTANDAGPSNAYELFKNAGSIFGPVITPIAHIDTPFNIVDTTATYYANVIHDANILPAGNLNSNNVVYRGARAAFKKQQGDIVNIRTNDLSNIGVSGGSNIVVNGSAGTDKMMMWAYPASLGAPSALNYYNGFSNSPVLGDLVTEAPQMVNDANGGNPVSYNVYTYTQLINFTAADVLTLTI